jgi:hypothetical protein
MPRGSFVEHDAERHRGDQPGIRTPHNERPHRDALDNDAPQRTGCQRDDDRNRQRPFQRHPKAEAQHRAKHHGAALREIHRPRYGVGDVETKRQQSVHAAETEPGNNRGCNQHVAAFAKA